MPETADRFGISDPLDPRENLIGGTRYLTMLKELFKEVPDSITRIKFMLAAYNVGNGHLIDAIKLTQKYGANPNRWKIMWKNIFY